MNKYDYQSEWVKGPQCAPAVRRRAAARRRYEALPLKFHPDAFLNASRAIDAARKAHDASLP